MYIWVECVWAKLVGSRSVVGVASRPHLKNLPRNLLHFSQHLPSTHTYPGNIEVFKGMQIKELNLAVCMNLKGGCMELSWWGQDQ